MGEVNELVREGIKALKAGDRAQARASLLRALEIDERNEQAWLWLSAVVDKPAEQEICLENVLTLNPANEHAQRGLQKVREAMGQRTPPEEEQAAPQPAPPQAAEVSPGPAPRAEGSESAPVGGSGSFLSGLGVLGAPGASSTRPGKKKTSLAALLAEDERLPAARSKRQAGGRGALALLDAWVSALIFDGKGAYEAERPHANIGRTVLGVAGAALVAAVMTGVGAYVYTNRLVGLLPYSDMSLMPPPMFAALLGGSVMIVSLLTIPIIVVYFFVMAFGMQKAAQLLMRSRQDYFTSAHLFSISFAPTTIISSFVSMLALLVVSFAVGAVDLSSEASLYQSLDRFSQVGGLFPLVSAGVWLYSMAVWTHGLAAAHKIGVLGGVVTLIAGLLLTTIFCVALACLFALLMQFTYTPAVGYASGP